MKYFLLSTTAMLVCASCACDVAASYPGEASVQNDEIEIAITANACNVHVAIDDNLKVRDAYSKRLVIDSVQAGRHRVLIAMGRDGFDGFDGTAHDAIVVVSFQRRSSMVVAAPTVAVAQAVISGAV